MALKELRRKECTIYLSGAEYQTLPQTFKVKRQRSLLASVWEQSNTKGCCGTQTLATEGSHHAPRVKEVRGENKDHGTLHGIGGLWRHSYGQRWGFK